MRIARSVKVIFFVWLAVVLFGALFTSQLFPRWYNARVARQVDALTMEMSTWTKGQVLEFIDYHRKDASVDRLVLTIEQRDVLVETLRTFENPNVQPLTPKQLLEYIEIFRLEIDITEEQIPAGEDFVLTATDETEDILFSLNFFTTGLHDFSRLLFPFLIPDRLSNRLYYDPLYHNVSEEFLEAYLRALDVKEHYTGWSLTAQAT